MIFNIDNFKGTYKTFDNKYPMLFTQQSKTTNNQSNSQACTYIHTRHYYANVMRGLKNSRDTESDTKKKKPSKLYAIIRNDD